LSLVNYHLAFAAIAISAADAAQIDAGFVCRLKQDRAITNFCFQSTWLKMNNTFFVF
jgi:hypothetical protein